MPLAHHLRRKPPPRSPSPSPPRTPPTPSHPSRRYVRAEQDRHDEDSYRAAASVRVTVVPPSASVMAAAAPAKAGAEKIVLQPIKDISGTVKLPGSQSLASRILLLSALADVFKLLG